MKMKFFFVDTCNSEAEIESISLEAGRERFADMWRNDDYWDDHFESEQEFDEYIESIFTCDFDELSDRLDGLGYALMTEEDISDYNERYPDTPIIFVE